MTDNRRGIEIIPPVTYSRFLRTVKLAAPQLLTSHQSSSIRRSSAFHGDSINNRPPDDDFRLHNARPVLLFSANKHGRAFIGSNSASRDI